MGRGAVKPLYAQKHMPVHPNLMQYYDSDIFVEEGVVTGVIITEHCDGGLLSDVVTQTYPQTLSEKMILGILRDLSCALFALHSLDPPVSHRNINVLWLFVSLSVRSRTTSTFTPAVVANWRRRGR